MMLAEAWHGAAREASQCIAQKVSQLRKPRQRKTSRSGQVATIGEDAKFVCLL